MDTFVYMVMLQTDERTGPSVADFQRHCPQNYEVKREGTAYRLTCRKGGGYPTRRLHKQLSPYMSGTRNNFPYEDVVPRDNPGVYGLTKSFGEQVCEYFAREHDMSLIALRITGPSTREQWLERYAQPKDSSVHIWWTDEQDLATAYLAAISVEHEGFDAFFISGGS